MDAPKHRLARQRRVRPPLSEPVVGAVIRGHRTSSKADSSTQELAALVEHALLDQMVCLQEDRLGDRQPEPLRGLEIDH
jgi:hypothetical protein